MENKDYILKKISSLLGIGIFHVQENEIIHFKEPPESNPIYRSRQLRSVLAKGADRQEKPYIYKDEYMVCFVCIKAKGSYYMIGPMSLELLGRVELYQFNKKYGISEEAQKRLKHFHLSEVLDIAELLGNLLVNKEYTDNELIYSNDFAEDTKAKAEQEQIVFELKEDEEELFHHTYLEERKLLDSVRNGQVENALRYSRNMDIELGKLSKKEFNHWKNVAVVAITLCTRAAIEGGVSPSIAYRLSDFYIQKSDECSDLVQIIEYRNRAVEELTGRVLKRQQSIGRSNYIEQCKDYVGKHYREKIYLSDIAQTMGLSETYLSRLFKKETNIRLQDYIVEIRLEHAANLLKYSNESISNVAEYVNFPSQSYMGKLFKEKYQLSPKQYRELNKPSEYVVQNKVKKSKKKI